MEIVHYATSAQSRWFPHELCLLKKTKKSPGKHLYAHASRTLFSKRVRKSIFNAYTYVGYAEYGFLEFWSRSVQSECFAHCAS